MRDPILLSPLTRPWRNLALTALLTASAACGLAGCGDEETQAGVCKGAQIFPHLSPFNLGESYPTPDNADDVNLGSNETTPYEATLLLQAPCEAGVTVQKVCLVGDPARNGDDVDQFIVEGPRPSDSIGRNKEVGIRLTYMRDAPGEVDNVALVIQSNAENFPTLVVPVCAHVIEADQPRMSLTCESPVVLEEGQRDDTLCP